MGTHIRFDWAIKKILRTKSNFVVLEGFLSELLGFDLKIKSLIESESNKETEESKSNRVDILVEDEHGRLTIVEIQNSSEIDYFHRIAFNSSRLISEYIERGKPYEDIKKIITVNIVYFDIGQGHDYIYHGNTTFKGMHDENDVLKPSAAQMKKYSIKNVGDIFPEHYIIKVNNFDDVAKNTLDEWIYFLKNSEIKKEFSAKGLNEARVKLDEINLNPEERKEYKIFLKYLHDEASFVMNAQFELSEAIEKLNMEKEKIKIEGNIETAKNLLKEGISLEIILKTTGLKKEDLI